MIEKLIQELTKKFSISEEQAKGGLGLLLKFCQDKLDAKNFAKVTDLLGDNWEELIKAAPAAQASIMGKLSGFASVFGEKAAKLGAMANLATEFKKINIDLSKIQPFVDTVVGYLQDKGGPQVKELLNKFLKR